MGRGLNVLQGVFSYILIKAFFLSRYQITPLLKRAFEEVVPHVMSQDIMIPASSHIDGHMDLDFDPDSNSNVISIADSPDRNDHSEISLPEPDIIVIDSDSD